MEKEVVIEAVVNHIEDLGMKDIRADIDGYPSPKRIKWKDSTVGYAPDITASSKKKTYLFDIADNTESLQDFENRWRLFSIFSHYNHGDFYIVSMANREFTIKNFLADLKIKAKVFPVTKQ